MAKAGVTELPVREKRVGGAFLKKLKLKCTIDSRIETRLPSSLAVFNSDGVSLTCATCLIANRDRDVVITTEKNVRRSKNRQWPVRADLYVLSSRCYLVRLTSSRFSSFMPKFGVIGPRHGG